MAENLKKLPLLVLLTSGKKILFNNKIGQNHSNEVMNS